MGEGVKGIPPLLLAPATQGSERQLRKLRRNRPVLGNSAFQRAV